jgi:hypothetical protein
MLLPQYSAQIDSVALGIRSPAITITREEKQPAINKKIIKYDDLKMSSKKKEKMEKLM